MNPEGQIPDRTLPVSRVMKSSVLFKPIWFRFLLLVTKNPIKRTKERMCNVYTLLTW